MAAATKLKPKKATDEMFKSPSLKDNWIKTHGNLTALQSELQKVLEKTLKATPKQIGELKRKIDIQMGIMSSCKRGFNLGTTKIRQITKFLQTETNQKRVRYCAFPELQKIKPITILYRNITIVYFIKTADRKTDDDIVYFREIETKSEKKVEVIENPKILDGSENI